MCSFLLTRLAFGPKSLEQRVLENSLKTCSRDNNSLGVEDLFRALFNPRNQLEHQSASLSKAGAPANERVRPTTRFALSLVGARAPPPPPSRRADVGSQSTQVGCETTVNREQQRSVFLQIFLHSEIVSIKLLITLWGRAGAPHWHDRFYQ
jgi:hypothetical protein